MGAVVPVVAIVIGLTPSALTQQEPTASEQLLMYELNRARHDPERYARENGLGGLLEGMAPTPPLAVNTRLVQSASFHAEEMATANYFAHQSIVTGDWPNKMVRDTGYALPTSWPNAQNYVESLAAGFSDVTSALRGLLEDAGVNPPGHRYHLLATGPDAYFWRQHREIGCGTAENRSSYYSRYYALHTAYSSSSDLFLTGVVYSDLDGNGRYDLNEGLGGVTVSTSTGVVATHSAGGWSLRVSPGTYSVTCSGGSFTGLATANVEVTTENVEVDFESGSSTAEVTFANQESVSSSQPTGGSAGGGEGGGGSGGCGSVGLDLMLPLAFLAWCRRRGYGFPSTTT